MNDNMKKYLKAQIRDKELYMDLFNMLLGIIIIVTALMCFLNYGETSSWYSLVFLLGLLMAVVNAMKFYKKSRVMTGICIACGVVLLLAAVACVAFLI